MSFFNKIKEMLFPVYETPEKPLKMIKDLDVLDTVWILDSSESLLKGWVWDINKKHVIVTVPLPENTFADFRFSITRPNTQTKLIESNKILFLNEPCMPEILSFIQHKTDTSNTSLEK